MRKLAEEDNVDETTPTQGFNIKSVMQDQFKLNMWDIGGQKEIRPYWRNYFDNTHALIYVIDSADTVRMEETALELSALLDEEKLANIPLLVFANKADLLTAMEPDAIVTALNEVRPIDDRAFHICQCSATKGGGSDIQEGIDW